MMQHRNRQREDVQVNMIVIMTHKKKKSSVKCTMIASNEGKFVTNITDTRTHRHNINIVTKNLCTEDPSAENTELFLVLSLKLLIAFV